MPEGESEAGAASRAVPPPLEAGQGASEPKAPLRHERHVEPHVGAALARVYVAASGPPIDAGAADAEPSEVCSREATNVVHMDDDELVYTRERAAPEARPVANKVTEAAQPRAIGRHWARGWGMRAKACHFAHAKPQEPSGLHHDLLLVSGTVVRVGAIRLDRSAHHAKLLRDVVGKGLPAVKYAFAYAGMVVWAVELPYGMAAALTRVPAVPRSDPRVGVHMEHPWGAWTRCSGRHGWSFPTSPGSWRQVACLGGTGDRRLGWAREGGSIAGCPNVSRDPVAVHP